MNNINILYVDDEQNNLTAFKASFRREYIIFTALSVAAAKEILKNEAIDIVFTDQRMPKETGVDLLEHVNKKYPNITSVLVTGYSDYESIVDSVNKGNVYKIINKPYKIEEIDLIIKEKQSQILKNKNDILVEELKSKNNELERTEELYRVLAKNIPGLVVIILDREYNYLLADGSGLNTDIESINDIEGKNIRDVMPLEEAEQIIKSYDTAFKKEESFSIEVKKDDRIYHSAFIPIKSETGLYDRGLVVLFDITDAKKIETQLESNLKELKRANEYLDNFVYSVAHDLKSPVANLKSLMDLLEILKGDDRIEVADKMKIGIRRLDKTLDSLVEIIDVQKNVNRVPEVVDLKAITEIVESNIDHHIKTINPIIRYDFKVKKILFVEVFLLSIFQNLISNSLKYSSKERVCVIDISAELIDDDVVVLTFKDNGIGIDEDDYDKIYEPFNRLSTQANGKGIGLHIVKSIVDNNGGRIEIQSEIGRGTEFKIYINEF